MIENLYYHSLILRKNKRKEAKRANKLRQQQSSSLEKVKNQNGTNSSQFLANSEGIPQVAVKPLIREEQTLTTEVLVEDETGTKDDTENNLELGENNSAPMANNDLEEDLNQYNGIENQGCEIEQKDVKHNEENGLSEEEKRKRKADRKKKKHSRKKRESRLPSVDDCEKEKEKATESDELLSKLPSPRRKSRDKHYIKDGDISDEEKQLKKESKRRKKRHKKRTESSTSQGESEIDGTKIIVDCEDISSKLPPPRKLPPI